MGKLDHPVIYKIRQEEINKAIQRYVQERKVSAVEFQYDDHHSIVIRYDYLRDNAVRSRAKKLLSQVETIHASNENRRSQFQQLLQATRAEFHNEDHEAQIWRIAVMEWMVKWPQYAFADDEAASLGRRFLRWAIDGGIGGVGPKMTQEFERHLLPVATKSGLIDLQVELQEDLNFNDLFYEFAPVAVSLALVLVPGGNARGLAMAIELVGNLFDFFLELHKMQSNDGKLDEREMKEVWWGVLGIFPFKITELICFGRIVVLFAPQLAQALYEAVQSFVARLEFMLEARDGGWEGALLADSPYALFIPDFAIAESRE